MCAVLLLGAIALAGAARLTWFTAGVDAVGRGTVAVTATGADLVPALSPVALLGLAAVAAVVALAGPARRALGALVALAGVGVGVVVVRLLLRAPTPADLAALPAAPAGGTPVPDSVALRPGPLVAVLGVLLLVAVGILLVVAEDRLARLGSRYARDDGGDGRRAVAAPAADGDPDRAAWDALDAGRDPTIGETPAPSTPPATSPSSRPPTDPPARPGRTDGGPRGRAV